MTKNVSRRYQFIQLLKSIVVIQEGCGSSPAPTPVGRNLANIMVTNLFFFLKERKHQHNQMPRHTIKKYLKHRTKNELLALTLTKLASGILKNAIDQSKFPHFNRIIGKLYH